MVKFISLFILFGVQLCMSQDFPAKLQVSVTSGYGLQDLRWSIAGNANGQNPNVLSELKWKGVAATITGMHLQYRIFRQWQLEGEYAHLFFLSGRVYDTDYGSNDRTNKVYDQRFNAGKGGADRWQAGLANRIPVTSNISITPSAGYGIFHQTLYIIGNSFSLPDLNSTYKTKWTGPYAQILCSVAPTKKLGMNAGLRYSQVQYRASANWNLIREFNHPESFRHTANGYGTHAQAAILYHASRMHSLGISGSYSCWQTGRGIDEQYLSTGASQQTQLNEVHTTGWQVMMEWRISFY